VCTSPSELAQSEDTKLLKPKINRDLPIDDATGEPNHITNRITLRPDEVVEALNNPPFYDADNVRQNSG
jgi:hypothetical protein